MRARETPAIVSASSSLWERAWPAAGAAAASAATSAAAATSARRMTPRSLMALGPVVPEDRPFGPWLRRPAPVRSVGRMSDDITILFDRIRLLLERQAAEREAAADTVEDTLTDGYARALALDGERLRAEERIRELAGSEEHAGEIRILKARLALVEEELSQLRGLLGTLARGR